MTRDDAAALLGVAADASADEVQRAFRRCVQQTHPDATGTPETPAPQAHPDLDALTAARDLLIAPSRVETPPQPSTGTVTPSGPVPPPPVAELGRFRHRPEASSLSGCLVLVFGSFIVVAVVAIALIATVGVLTTRGAPDRGVTDTTECVVIDEEVRVAACDAPAARRVVSQSSGARTCAVGLDTLVAGSTTWCLEPADG